MTKNLTTETVEALFASLRNTSQPVAYLCRAYLQFGPEAMGVEDLAKLSKAVDARGKVKS